MPGMAQGRARRTSSMVDCHSTADTSLKARGPTEALESTTSGPRSRSSRTVLEVGFRAACRAVDEGVPGAVLRKDRVAGEEVGLAVHGTDQKAHASVGVARGRYHLDAFEQGLSLVEQAIDGGDFADGGFLKPMTAELRAEQLLDIRERGACFVPVAQILVRDTAEFTNLPILVLQAGAVEEHVARVAHEKVGVRRHACEWMLRVRLPEIGKNLFHSCFL